MKILSISIVCSRRFILNSTIFKISKLSKVKKKISMSGDQSRDKLFLIAEFQRPKGGDAKPHTHRNPSTAFLMVSWLAALLTVAYDGPA